MSLRLFFCLLLLLSALGLPARLQAAELYSAVSVHSSSEPVPVYDMVNGWGDDVRSGRYAWADGRVQLGFAAQGWNFVLERRWHYDFRFSKDMAEFYASLERGDARPGDYALALQAKALQMRGWRVGYEFHWQRWRLQPILSVYRVDQYQIGDLHGVATLSTVNSASVLLDYHFDDDKLLAWPTAPEDGRGFSADFNLAYDGLRWQLELQLQDLWSRMELPAAAFTRGCINLGGAENPVCSSGNAVAGNSGYADYPYRTALQWPVAGCGYRPRVAVYGVLARPLSARQRTERLAYCRGRAGAVGPFHGAGSVCTGAVAGISWRWLNRPRPTGSKPGICRCSWRCVIRGRGPAR